MKRKIIGTIFVSMCCLAIIVLIKYNTNETSKEIYGIYSMTENKDVSDASGSVISVSDSKNDEIVGSNSGDVLNQYFPYKSGQSIKMNARLLFLGYLEGTVSLKFVMKKKGPKGEIWKVLIYDFSEELKESEMYMPANRKKIFYLYVQKDKIFWIYAKMTNEEIRRACKRGELPEAAEIICQENEIPDHYEGKSGEHSELSAIGKNVRQFRFYVISEGNGGGYDIRKIVLKKGVGLIGYRISETSAGRNSVELWNEEYVQSESYAEFRYKD